MTRDTPHSAKEAPAAGRCVVCLKAIGPGDARWMVHFRGAAYTVCCPSCVQLFNRSPRQFLEQP